MEQALPEAVREQAKAIEEFRKQQAEPVATTEVPAASATVVTEPEPLQQPAATDGVPAITPETNAEPADELKARLERLEKNVADSRSLLGRVPGLQSAIHERDAKIAELEAKIAAVPETPMTDEDLMKQFNLSKEQFEYGRDLWEGVRNVVRKEVQSNVKPLEKKMVDTSESQYMRDLDGYVPDWRKINVDPGFNTWLDEYDPIWKATRRDRLETADGQLDSEVTVAIFKAFKGSRPNTTPVVHKPGVSVESQIMPRPAASVQASTPGKRTYTEVEWKREADELTKGDPNHPDRAKRLLELRLAAKEGRITSSG